MNKARHVRAFRRVCVSSFVILALVAATAEAQQHESMPGMDMSHSTDTAASGSASTTAFRNADDRMMKDMSAPEYSGNADQDFVAHMIPHHQGAIEMAQVELKYGKDPELKRLARNIIHAQHSEIALMKRWQEKHGVK
jgi:uncharacterized protein (DUF305 family)